jgi:hypothetical protein
VLILSVPIGERLIIESSPYGRCMQTARIIAEEMACKHGDQADISVEINPMLQEVKGFVWAHFRPLPFGGLVNFNGQEFEVDVKKSNPEGLSLDDYFFHGHFKRIDPAVMAEWPADYAEHVRNIELPESARNRMVQCIRWATERLSSDICDSLFFASHDALCGFLVRAYTRGEVTSLDPGGYVVLETDGQDYRIICFDSWSISSLAWSYLKTSKFELADSLGNRLFY